MCNKRIDCLSESDLQSECPIANHPEQQQHQHQHLALDLMDSNNTLSSGSAPSSNDETPRVKFLCSFSGSILPRPQDGKLRYVGGETRIVSVPRDITYEELMAKMRELFEETMVLKYQQPDEDLDALVSVVNDDDVTNMMEEYDKLGAGDGFSRLRIFLFSQSDQDGLFADGDERDHEKRYVDALNSLNESPDFRRQQSSDFQGVVPSDDVHFAEQYFNQMSLDGSLQNQRNVEVPTAHVNLRHLRIPHQGSLQPQQSSNLRLNDMEAPWSPGYYSPRQIGTLDPRPFPEFPTSPSSGRFRTPYAEFSDRIPEDNRQQINYPPLYEHQPQYTENVVFQQTGPVHIEKAGFPGNIMHGPNLYEGSTICENCRASIQRNHVYSDSAWKPVEQPHIDSSTTGNGYLQVPNLCAECPPNRDMFLVNSESTAHRPYYPRDQNDPRCMYNETHGHDGGWALQHQSHPRTEEPMHVSGAGRLSDHYVLDNAMFLGHGNAADRNHIPSHYIHHEDPRLMRGGPELGNQVFHDQAVGVGAPIHPPPIEERVIRMGNPPHVYGADNIYQVPGHVPSPSMFRNIHSPGVLYETSSPPQLSNGSINPGFIRTTTDSPRSWVEYPQKKQGFDGSALAEYSNGQPLTMIPNSYAPQSHSPYAPGLSRLPSGTVLNNPVDPVLQLATQSPVDCKPFFITTAPESKNEDNETDKLRGEIVQGEVKRTQAAGLELLNTCNGTLPEKNMDLLDEPLSQSLHLSAQGQAAKDISAENLEANNGSSPLGQGESMDDRLNFLPELIASVKEARLESVKEVRCKAQADVEPKIEDVSAAKACQNEQDVTDTNGDLEIEADNENINHSKIEPTAAEEEAIKRGLQTIRNEDLEEIRELGSGTYGSVYHGKWKGSDVAIKRIKASCFAGKPSERERLIADFWKEALILSSLHHPNVVSFYGVVRDGPDGSLATVTEFMINGSLKQFLQKKDRTIDRRKRLIIAMDAAFGMEYLHGKNIVHFDLKCENLLVNMRDPHRPVCKIGDLGLSKVKQHTMVSGGVRGTLPWMAPELLSGKSNMVTEKIDVYSFGIVMWELLTGDEPYTDMHCASIIGGIVNNTLRPQIPTWCDPEWKSLMESCWSSEPAQRPSFSEISTKLRNMAAAMNLK